MMAGGKVLKNGGIKLMKMDKERFLKTEFGAELDSNIRALNYYLNEIIAAFVWTEGLF